MHMQADDRLLLITEGSEAGGSAGLAAGLRRGAPAEDAPAAPHTADLGVVHLQLPAPYLAANWPLLHAALSAGQCLTFPNSQMCSPVLVSTCSTRSG